MAGRWRVLDYDTEVAWLAEGMMAPRVSRTRRWLRLKGMTKVTAQMSISLDGRYAGPMDPRDPPGHGAGGA